MKQNLMGAFGLLLICSLVGISTSAKAGGATFQRSCTDIRIEGNELIANCRAINGSTRGSAITLKGIDNDDGNLVDTVDVAIMLVIIGVAQILALMEMSYQRLAEPGTVPPKTLLWN